jgi:hypothetical protein
MKKEFPFIYEPALDRLTSLDLSHSYDLSKTTLCIRVIDLCAYYINSSTFSMEQSARLHKNFPKVCLIKGFLTL